jgi:hypothetical protein
MIVLQSNDKHKKSTKYQGMAARRPGGKENTGEIWVGKNSRIPVISRHGEYCPGI